MVLEVKKTLQYMTGLPVMAGDGICASEFWDTKIKTVLNKKPKHSKFKMPMGLPLQS